MISIFYVILRLFNLNFLENILLKTKVFIILWAVGSFCTLANGRMQGRSSKIPVTEGDSVLAASVRDSGLAHIDSLRKRIAGSDTLAIADSLLSDTLLSDTLQTDSVPADSVKKSKSALDQPVSYSATDSMTYEAGISRANLYGSGKVNYMNLELQADLITMNLDSSMFMPWGARIPQVK